MRRLFLLAPKLFSWLMIGLAVAACGKSQEPAKAPEAAPPEPAAVAAPAPTADTTAIEASIANGERSKEDKDQDSWRRPAEVLTFMELRPGLHTLDYFAASGYYTELMSRIVGADGKVIAYNNPEYRKFSEDGPTKRYGNNRLPNVVEVTTPVEAVQLDPASLDAVLFMQSYHDLYWRPKDGSWPQTDAAKALAQLVPALKPGAVVVVVDHVASAGGEPTETVTAMHRIDPAILKRDFEAAGLKFDSESSLFANPADDHKKEVFDKSIRHKTDQVMYKFRKS
jgi:predicted methyltransferase